MERIRLIVTSDMHAHVFPHSYADGREVNEGMGRVSTLVELLKTDNTLLLDNGDLIEGSPLAAYHYAEKRDDISPMTTMMYEMGYNYINVGNHDFSYGEEALLMHLQNAGVPCLTGNWLFHGKPFGPTYAVEEMAGKKICLFGLVTHCIPNWEKRENLRHSRFTNALESAKKTVDTIRRMEKPDYIICLYHGGFERDPQNGLYLSEDNGENQAYQIISEVPGIDVLITGHQHRSLCGRMNNTVYTQTAPDGKELAVIDIYPESGAIDARLYPVDTEPDTDLLRYVKQEEESCQAWLDEKVGAATMDLRVEDSYRARKEKHQLVTFFNKVMMEAGEAQLAGSYLHNDARGFHGEITRRDLFNAWPHANTVVVKKVTGKVLKEYLERCAEYWCVRGEEVTVSPLFEKPKPRHSSYDMVDGVEYTIKVSNPVGRRITALTYQGKDVADDDEFTLCVNSYRAGGGGNFPMLKDAETVKVLPGNIISLACDYLAAHPILDFEPVSNIHLEK